MTSDRSGIDSAKIRIQSFGRFLSNMVMPNIGAFIAWGFITALFIPKGWVPNETLAKLVGPMITYLLPLLIGYTGGRMAGGERGAVVGAVTTMGVVVGSDIPMFLGAMIAGPLGGLAIRGFDSLIDGRVRAGFEMLINNFSAGIVGMVCAIIAFLLIGPFVMVASDVLEAGVNYLVKLSLLPLTSLFVEPAKILFLNNAINHGIFTPLGVQQASETGKSIFFLIEANPGPGLGVLLAYMLLGRGATAKSAAGASIIHFLGGIHEIYFPYVLMKPRLILAVIAGGITGVYTLFLFKAGLVAPASPGSIFAVLLMTPRSSMLGVLLSITAAAAVSFFVSSLLLKTAEEDDDDLEAAAAKMVSMKSASRGRVSDSVVDFGKIDTVQVACDAGMGSSAMGASLLRKKVEAAGLAVSVSNCAINTLDEHSQLVITHKDLTDRARSVAPKAHHISLVNFVDGDFYDDLVHSLKQGREKGSTVLSKKRVAEKPATLFRLTVNDIHLGLKAANKEEAIRYAGQHLVDVGCVEPEYIDAMLEREKIVSTYLGESIATPHGTEASKDKVLKAGVAFCQYPEGVAFDDAGEEVARLVVAIAARNNEHIHVLSAITNALDEPALIERVVTEQDPEMVLEMLGL